MKNLANYIWPVALILLGLTVLISPVGRVPRVQYEFGDYKYIAGSLFLSFGILLIISLRGKDGKWGTPTNGPASFS